MIRRIILLSFIQPLDSLHQAEAIIDVHADLRRHEKEEFPGEDNERLKRK